MDEELGFDLQITGTQEAIRKLQPVINTIQQFSVEVNKLSKNLNNALSALFNFSKESSNLNAPKAKKEGILKSKNNRLNIGDFTNIETERMNKSFAIIYKRLDTSFINAALKNTSNEIKSINNNSRQTIGTINRFNKSINNTAKSSKDLVRSLWNFGKVVYMARRAASMIAGLVKESGSWIENLNLFAVTFGDNYQETLDWALEFADRLGVANNEIVKMTGLFKQLSTSIGLADELGDTLSQTLTQLAYDFASFYNLTDVAEASEKLQAGIFSGQIRTLRSLGIDVSQESVDNMLKTNEALAKFNISANQLTQSQKVIARVILTMEASSNAFGDMARSIDTLQNRVRVLQGAFANLKLALGDALSSFVRDALAYVIGAVQAFTEIIRAFVPIKKELTYDLGDNVFTEIAEDAENANNAIGQLSFDKFESLTSDENENLTITQALTDELLRQQEAYEQISSQFDGIDEKVISIRSSLLKWIFPTATIDEKTGEIVGEAGELNDTLKSIIGIAKTLGSIMTKFWNSFKIILPDITRASEILLKIFDFIVGILDKLNLLYPLLLALIGIGIYKKLSSLLGLSGKLSAFISGMGKFLTNFKSMAHVLTDGSFGTEAQLTLTKYFTKFEKQVQHGREVLVGSLDKAKVAATALNSVMAAVMAYQLADSFFGQFEKEGKVIAGALGIVAAALMGVAAAAMAAVGALSWGTAIPAIVAAIGIGVAGIKATVEGAKEIKGFAIGGIPEKSELFYMNEYGVPEALINTGGSQTNVINIDQLSEGMRRGFVSAILETGLNDIASPTITLGSNINDSALARAIFPALKTESKRQGGNQL